MKLDSLLSLASLAGLSALSGGIALDLAALPLFATAAIALFLLLCTGDYRPRRDYAASTTIALRRSQPLPLAA
jgi:hypothetical protein